MQNLPSEVISISLRYAGMPQTSRQLSRGMHTASSLDYLESICNEPIKEDELNEYINNKITVGTVWGKLDPMGFTIYTPLLEQGYTNDMSIYLGQSDDEIDPVGHGEEYVNKIYNPNITDYDLITTYRVLKARIGCISINPNFAKDKASQMFNDLVDQWYNKDNLIYLYGYLYMNMRVMNLQINKPNPLDIATSIVVDQDLEVFNKAFDEYIPDMIDNIKTYFNIISNYY